MNLQKNSKICLDIFKISAQYGHPADADLLNRELQTWKNAYLSLIWLEKQAQAYTMGAQPVDYLRKAHGLSNGDLPVNKTYGLKYDSDSLTKVTKWKT